MLTGSMEARVAMHPPMDDPMMNWGTGAPPGRVGGKPGSREGVEEGGEQGMDKEDSQEGEEWDLEFVCSQQLHITTVFFNTA